MKLLSIDLAASEPFADYELEQGVVDLYIRTPELEESSSVWFAAADDAGVDTRDVPRVTAQLASRWRTQVVEHDGVTLVVGRYRLLEEAEILRGLIETGETFEGERAPLVAALTAASRLLELVPEDWLITLDEAADRYRVSRRMMTQYCLQGRVPGAHKRGKSWWVPDSFEVVPHPENPRRRRHGRIG